MYLQALILSVLMAMGEARFAQEQVPIPAISALGAFGNSGDAATLAGQSISFLLAAANPCGKLSQADKIVATLGTDPQVIAAARGLVAAEQNFNPFDVAIPSICSNVSLPATAELRGVVPLVDPAVTGSDGENSKSATSLNNPFDATGLSVAEVMAAQGFSNFTTKAADGTSGAAPAAGIGGAAASSAVPTVSSNMSVSAAVGGCTPSTTFVTATRATASAVSSASQGVVASSGDATAAEPASGGAGAVRDAVKGSFGGFVASSIAGNNFGTCTPTIKFEAGLNGRKETEFTFQAIDPVVNKGQQEALNPNIITNRICDQLGNACGVSDAGKAACLSAKATISALGTRDQTTADRWNELLGFAGTDTNPDQAPKTGLVGHS
ncbi:hypothetical protein LZ554_004299 [Drepanopeziza brunnea f. sp. 'monogermtubi']|nr:hypothetical protein LZ554_004299 [Drepanopeziza brunnea f. sp. 'monogermtubi']